MGKVEVTRKSKLESEKKERIRKALAARESRDPQPTFRNLVLEFGVAQSELCDRASGKRQNRRRAHEHQQKLPLGTEKALENWFQDMDDSGFPPFGYSARHGPVPGQEKG